MTPTESISAITNSSTCDPDVFKDFKQRIEEGSLSRDENPKTHFGVFFLPYNFKNKKVFLVHHKKAGSWISPGGHMDKGEVPYETLNREIFEELGIKKFFKTEPKPFLLTTVKINRDTHPCKKHYDIWYLVPTDGRDFNVDQQEFLDTKWLTVEEARALVTDPSNIKALNLVEQTHV